MPSTWSRFPRFSTVHALALGTALSLAPSAWAAPASEFFHEASIQTPVGKLTVRQIQRTANLGTPPTADGDSYSFQHKLGADGVPCSSPQNQEVDDDTVLFDGLSELLDPYLDGTQPFVFEFETPDAMGNTTDVFMNSFSGKGGDLFPEGFTDPGTGDPLTDACIELGMEDMLDFDQPTEVESAMIEASDSNGSVIPPTDITSIFPNPFDGSVQIQLENGAGQGINGMILDITVKPMEFDPQPIFADGFESGDASSWTDSAP